MFRKPKGKNKAARNRRKRDDDSDDDDKGLNNSGANNNDDGETTSDLISEARKRLKTGGGGSTSNSSTSVLSSKRSSDNTLVCRPVTTTDTTAPQSGEGAASVSNADLATRGALHLPTKEEMQKQKQKQQQDGRGTDGIYRNAARNKFLAGPIKASQNIRVTARFDYQPDVCKDYKQTGFCGYGDTCIYLHDRGDTLSGWQLEQQWEEQQKQKKQQEEAQLAEFMDGKRSKPGNNDGDASNTNKTGDGNFPFACFLSREAFVDPVVTTCGHYFSQANILDYFKSHNGATECPICGKDTQGVLNQPKKLLAYQRRVLGLSESKQDDSWQVLFDKFSQKE
mmetsp:Transcript_9230/g.19900  ORF Transcript_9230/g.19900 Transcript_9230/m.19900 type:complete len:338 (-) Transcript_9230:79-1092(-)